MNRLAVNIGMFLVGGLAVWSNHVIVMILVLAVIGLIELNASEEGFKTHYLEGRVERLKSNLESKEKLADSQYEMIQRQQELLDRQAKMIDELQDEIIGDRNE